MSFNKLDKKTPFCPGNTVSYECFVGRKNIIDDIIKYLPTIYDGKNRHFFLVGKRGMGKSSLSSLIAFIMEKKYNMLPIIVSNDGVTTLDELITKIIESLINKISNQSWAKKIIHGFGEHVESVGYMGLNLKFHPKNDNFLKAIKEDFPLFIKNICQDIKDKDGIFIIIDDVNGLSSTPEFVNWYKAFVDNMTMRYDGETPIGFLLTSNPENLEKLNRQNSSFSRIFYHFDVDSLETNETKEFYVKHFQKVGITYDQESINLLSKYCYGVPLMMQELGERVFWKCENNILDINTAIKSIQSTNTVIRDKYLDSLITDPIYSNILEKISNIITPNNDNFSIKELKTNSTTEEEDLINIFILESRKRGIILGEEYGFKDECRFINPLYSIYLRNKHFI